MSLETYDDNLGEYTLIKLIRDGDQVLPTSPMDLKQLSITEKLLISIRTCLMVKMLVPFDI